MDSIGGAKILSKRLLRGDDDGAAPAIAPIAATDALPLFHWAGVEPAPAVAAPEERRLRRSRRFRGR